MSNVDPIPKDHAPLTAYLACKGAGDAIDWYVRVFGAVEKRKRLATPDGTVLNAELWLGKALFMVSEQAPDIGTKSPAETGSTSVILVHYVEDVDAVFARAIEAGAEKLIDVDVQFYGHRTGRLRDPFGHVWIISTVVEDVPDDEMMRRFEAMFG